MKIQSKILVSALTLALTSALGTTFAVAGDFGRYRDHPHFGGWEFITNGGDGLPSFVPSGTFVGGISAVYERGNGLYLSIAPGIVAVPELRTLPAPKAKIIKVTASRPNAACSMEVGVCVIRGGN